MRVRGERSGEYLRGPQGALQVDPGVHDGGRPDQDEGAQPPLAAVQHPKVHILPCRLDPENAFVSRILWLVAEGTPVCHTAR